MTLLLSRPVSFPDIGLNDQDQDPNSALLELDRGLKSSQIGEQCEAISRFPVLFEKYPFPILINSALLKLAEVFRQEIPGSNFVRVCVVEVIESSGKHLDKLINVEEFLRRVTAVMHSNDPLARALTLSLLGWMSVVVGENLQVHHLIREALDAKHAQERQAAILAAEKYASKSKTFSMSMCECLSGIIGSLAAPVDVKLQLIKVFQHMHHDAETAATVRGLCLDLLREHPTQRVVVTILHTLTELASHSLVDIPQQVDLLMSCLESESRVGVRHSILCELLSLSEAAPHAWAQHNVKALIAFTMAGLERREGSTRALSVLSSLLAASAGPQLNAEIESSLLELSRICLYNTNLDIAGKGIILFTNIALYMQSERNENQLCQEALDGAVNILQSLIADKLRTRERRSLLKACMMCAISLARNNLELSASFVQTLIQTLGNKSLSPPIVKMVCESLTSLGGCQINVLSSSFGPLKNLIQQNSSKENKEILSSLVTLMLQAFHCHQWPPGTMEAIQTATQNLDGWTNYQIGRQASRYGHHTFAQSVYGQLSSSVCSDQSHFWLVALADLSRGESMPSQEGSRLDNLMAANFHLSRALTSLKAASTTHQPLSFCQEYVALRAETAMCHSQLIHACLSLRTAPPPAIAAPILASSARDEMLRCGRVAQQLSKSAKDFGQLTDKYEKLFQSSFDADPPTLCHLALLQESATLMNRATEIIIRPSPPVDFPRLDLTSIKNKLGGDTTIENQSLMNALQEASKVASKLAQVCHEVKPIREQHLNLIQRTSQTLTSLPLPYPRFFFQRLQNTDITLNLSPQPRTPSDPICVQTTGQLAIKVEGVIVHGKRPGLYRTVQSVTLVVNSQIQNRPAHTLDSKIEPNELLSQTVNPHNDFFSTQFLLGFPLPGLYQVTVDASATDTFDDMWQTGPSLSLSIKAQEDPSQKSASTSSRSIAGHSGSQNIAGHGTSSGAQIAGGAQLGTAAAAVTTGSSVTGSQYSSCARQ